MYNYKLLVEYDGSRYDGWQRLGKDESNNTIENKINEIIKKMTEEEVELFCGSRTEKGVHAYAQVANFKLKKQQKVLDIKNYLNRYLPRDIAVLEVEEVDERFHSQLNAKARTYVYQIDTKNVANVFERKYMYHAFYKLDIDTMQKAAEYFIGKYDYKAFSTAKKSKSTEKTVQSITIVDDGNVATITITANDFLHNMARLMVGILLEVGNGTRKPEAVRDILDGKEVPLSPPADSLGMFLKQIQY